jgi:Protein of unknown function (DUF2934)
MRNDLKQTPETAGINRMLPADNEMRHAEIAARAYELWQARGRPQGSPEIDWFRAEHELSESPTATLLAA